MKFSLTTFLSAFLTIVIFGQEPVRILTNSRPRVGLNADSIGHYDFVPRIDNAILNKGEYLNIEVYFTGYGQIENAKFVFYPSIDVIDPEKSTVAYDLVMDKDTIRGFGSKTANVDENGVFLGFSSIDKWSFFIDWNNAGGNTPQILTETRGNGTAPVLLRLKIRRKAAAGNHFLNFAFTYFNGKEWAGSNQQIQFTVRNVFQRHEIFLSILVLLATVLTIFASIKPAFESIKSFIARFKKKQPVRKSIGVKDKK